jgi:hypothetical protein
VAAAEVISMTSTQLAERLYTFGRLEHGERRHVLRVVEDWPSGWPNALQLHQSVRRRALCGRRAPDQWVDVGATYKLDPEPPLCARCRRALERQRIKAPRAEP